MQNKNETMLPEQYHDEILKLESEHRNKVRELQVKFLKLTKKYKVGDIITDHIGSIIVERIGMDVTRQKVPIAIYHGHELKKNGKPRKDGKIRTVWETNIK